jgi:hypothetical protein
MITTPIATITTYKNFNPAGGWDMMDENILDHDIFSKMALGWTTPYVVSGDCTLEINPSETKGNCILVAPSSWNQTAFDEYLLMELYTPTDLNYLDSHTAYSSREKHYTTYGVKLYHIDARVVRYSSITKTWAFYSEPVSIAIIMAMRSDRATATRTQRSAIRIIP